MVKETKSNQPCPTVYKNILRSIVLLMFSAKNMLVTSISCLMVVLNLNLLAAPISLENHPETYVPSIRFRYASSLSSGEVDRSSILKYSNTYCVDSVTPIHMFAPPKELPITEKQKWKILVYESSVKGNVHERISGHFGLRLCAMEHLLGFSFAQYAGLSALLLKYNHANRLYATCEWIGLSDGLFLRQSHSANLALHLQSQKKPLKIGLSVGAVGIASPKTESLLWDPFAGLSTLKNAQIDQTNCKKNSMNSRSHIMAFASLEVQCAFRRKHAIGFTCGAYGANKKIYTSTDNNSNKLYRTEAFYVWTPSDAGTMRFSYTKFLREHDKGNFGIKISIQE